MVAPVSNVEPNFEVIGMKAVVLNSMGYSLSLRCSFARACLVIGGGGLDLGEKGRARNQHGGLRQRPVQRASCHIDGDAGSGVTGLDRKMHPSADPANHAPFAALEKACSL